MAKLFIICGHGAGDPGCCAGGYTEAERVRALGQRIKELGGSEVELGDTSRNWYADGGLNRLSTDAPVVELHMDASGIATAHGAHVIIKEGFEPDEYDNALADKLAAFMPGRSEKLVRRSDLANPNRAAARGINYRLCENGFIDNDGDREKFNGNLDELARIYLECFGITAGSAPAAVPQRSLRSRKRPRTSAAPTAALWTTCACATPRPGRHRGGALFQRRDRDAG